MIQNLLREKGAQMNRMGESSSEHHMGIKLKIRESTPPILPLKTAFELTNNIWVSCAPLPRLQSWSLYIIHQINVSFET